MIAAGPVTFHWKAVRQWGLRELSFLIAKVPPKEAWRNFNPSRSVLLTYSLGVLPTEKHPSPSTKPAMYARLVSSVASVGLGPVIADLNVTLNRDCHVQMFS